MVTIYNKSVRPIGVANQSVLPGKDIKIQDKYAYCDVYDEDGNNTGKRQILPGLRALENMGFITVKEEEAQSVKEEEQKPAEEENKESEQESVGEESKEEKPKAKRGRRAKTEE